MVNVIISKSRSYPQKRNTVIHHKNKANNFLLLRQGGTNQAS